MCDPVSLSIALAVTAVAQTAGSVIAQSKNAKAQTRAINAQQERVAEENRDAASAELFDQMRGARREQGKIRVAAGEAGLGLNGGSIEGLLFDSAMQMEMQGSRTLANLESRQAANNAEAESMLSQVQKPTALGAGLQIGGAALSGFAGYKNAQLQVKKAGDV